MPGYPGTPSVQTVTDVLAAIASSVGNVAGYYVWLVNIATGTIYGPSTKTDSGGNWSIASVPAGIYESFYGSESPVGTVPTQWQATGVKGYLVALNPPIDKGMQLFNARAYSGFSADAVRLTDGAITTGTQAFTSASASFTQADVGKLIGVDGAGAAFAGAWLALSTTIQSVQSATACTLTAAASHTVSAARTAYGTDNRLPIQAAIADANAAASPGAPATVLVTGKCLMSKGAALSAHQPCLNLYSNVTLMGSGAAGSMLIQDGWTSTQNTVIAPQSAAGAASTGWRVFGIGFDGNYGQTSEQAEQGITTDACDDFAVSGCEFAHFGGKPFLATSATNFWVNDNHIHDCASNAIGTATCNGFSIARNLIHDAYANAATSGVECIVDVTVSTRGVLMGNVCRNYGNLSMGPSTDMTIVGNYVSLPAGASAGGGWGCLGVFAGRNVYANNILDNNGATAGPCISGPNAGGAGMSIIGNVCRSTSTGGAISISGAATGLTLVGNQAIGGATATVIVSNLVDLLVGLNYFEGLTSLGNNTAMMVVGNAFAGGIGSLCSQQVWFGNYISQAVTINTNGSGTAFMGNYVNWTPGTGDIFVPAVAGYTNYLMIAFNLVVNAGTGRFYQDAGGAHSNLICINNVVLGGVAFVFNAGDTNYVLRGNVGTATGLNGTNPGLIGGTPAVVNTAVTNNTGYDCAVYIATGATNNVPAVVLQGKTTGLVIPVSSTAFAGVVLAGSTIQLTGATVAGTTWAWLPL